jgi:predicted ArsR family transcriptional regulator
MAKRGRRKLEGPSPANLKVYRYIISFTCENGYQPSMQDVANGLGLRSRNAVLCHVKSLVKFGYVEIRDGSSRGRAIAFLRLPDGRPFCGFGIRKPPADPTPE